MPITSVAISRAQQDTGEFQVNFQSEKYGPFEGAGVISRCALQLPEFPQFDYRSISDVIMHVSYTSLDGGMGWRKTANEAVGNYLAETETRSNVTLFDLGHNPSAQWLAGTGSTPTTVTLNDVVNDVDYQLPFWRKSKGVKYGQAWLVSSSRVVLPQGTKINEVDNWDWQVECHWDKTYRGSASSLPGWCRREETSSDTGGRIEKI